MTACPVDIPSYPAGSRRGDWSYLKRVKLGNTCCHDLDELQTALIRAQGRLRHRRADDRARSRQGGYSVERVTWRSGGRATVGT
jgi:hypothetical protein